MELEELKLLLDAMAVAGNGAQEMFFWWLACRVFDSLCAASVMGGLIFAAYCLCAPMVVDHMQKIRELLNIGTPGPTSSGEYRATLARIRELLEIEASIKKDSFSK